MRDIYYNGPAVCSLNTGYLFNLYSSGIYDTISEKNWKALGITKPQWLKVEHSVLCVGWGIFLIIYLRL